MARKVQVRAVLHFQYEVEADQSTSDEEVKQKFYEIDADTILETIIDQEEGFDFEFEVNTLLPSEKP